MKKRSKKNLQIEVAGMGSWKLTTTLYNREISAITTNSKDIDILNFEDYSDWKKEGAKNRLISECIENYKSGLKVG